MRSLVLGGSTFVGRRLVQQLVGQGHEVSVLNRGRTPSALPPEVGRFIADRTDVGSMRSALEGTEWDAIFDVSGFVMVAGGSPIADLLELLDGRTAAYVFVSSIMAYQPSALMPWTEDQPASTEPVSAYGGFKAYAEAEVLKRHELTGFPGSIARPAAIYGPDNNILDMEAAMFLRLRRQLPILLPHAGLVTGNYGHVDDLCALLITMAQSPATVSGEVVNATGQAITTAGYVHALAEIVGAAPAGPPASRRDAGEGARPAVRPSVRRPAPRRPLDGQGATAQPARRARLRRRAPADVRMVRVVAARRCAGRDVRPGLGGRLRLRGRGEGAGDAMTVFVDDATLRDAQDRAARLPLGPVEQQRWREVAAYGAARRPDPNPERAAVLRDLLSMPGADDRQVLDATGRLLSDAVTGNAGSAGLARQVYALCLRWFDEDVKEAAPLLELFTGHHRDPEGGPPQADPELVGRLAEWLTERTGPAAQLDDVTVISGGFSRLMLDVRWTSGHGVVRIEQDGMFATEGRREAAVMRILRARGYPVPAVLWEEPDPGVLGHPFFVMEHVAGRARTDDEGLDDMLRSLAQLHGLGKEAVDEVAALDGLPAGREPEQAINAQLRHWHDVYRSAVDYPIPAA